MIGKINLKSFRAVSSKIVHRKCPRCGKTAKTERVDYGPGGVVFFCECGHVREIAKK